MENNQIPLEIQWLCRLPIQSFKTCFVIGTALLACFALTEELYVAVIGAFFLQIAIICNLILFCVEIYHAFIYKKYRKQILLHTSVMLINIPVAMLYSYIVTEFLLIKSL